MIPTGDARSATTTWDRNMKQKLDELLCKKYPEIFVDRHGDMRETCMVWGFSCGDGWYPLIDELCSKIVEHCISTGARVPHAVQVKEKFATLRFYIDAGDDEIYRLIGEAERKSAITCELTGVPGVLCCGDPSGHGWYRTLSPEAADESGFYVVKREEDDDEDNVQG
jgi:hypothetical protein